MGDFTTYDPADFTLDELDRAAHGDSRIMAPSLAVELLRAKADVDTEATMARLAQDEDADPRARHAATLALADYPAAAPLLRELVGSSDARVAQAARTALARHL